MTQTRFSHRDPRANTDMKLVTALKHMRIDMRNQVDLVITDHRAVANRVEMKIGILSLVVCESPHRQFSSSPFNIVTLILRIGDRLNGILKENMSQEVIPPAENSEIKAIFGYSSRNSADVQFCQSRDRTLRRGHRTLQSLCEPAWRSPYGSAQLLLGGVTVPMTRSSSHTT